MDTATAPCILIVDDNPDLRGTFATLFGRDYRVLEASSGPEALSLLKTQAPRLMVLDFSMPGMNGLEVLKAVKTTHPSLLIIMLTSERDIETAQGALSLGACEFVTKPFDIEYLRSEIERLLDTTKDGATKQDTSGRPWKILP